MVALGLILAVAPAALAKKGGVPPGQAKKQAAATDAHHGTHHAEGHRDAPAGAPPGWSHGKKTGWHGSPYPPGWSKWDKEKQHRWTGDRDAAHAEIDRLYERYRIPTPQRNEITDAFNQAIAGGLVINDAKNKLVGALEDEGARRNLMIDTTQSTLELLKK
jgi:hypothetical protein